MKKGLFHKKKRKLSFEKKENTMKKLETQTILSVRKMNLDEKNNNEINKEIDDYFYSPEKYFKENSPITVGKKVYIFDINDPKLRKNKRLQTERIKSKNYLKNFSKLKAKMSKNDIKMINDKNINNFLDMKSKFEVIDNNKLKKIFNSYKLKESKDYSINSEISNSSDTNQLFENKSNLSKNYLYTSSYISNVPSNIKNSLILQNRKLNLQKSFENQNLRISRFLSKKINKPQNNLLLNNLDSFLFKKEIIKEIEFNKPVNEQYGNNNWNISLRRPLHFQGVRDTYININGDRYKPFWSIVIERSPRQRQMCLKPGHVINKKGINIFKRQNNSLCHKNKTQYYKTIENLEDLNVDGKNLFNLEYKREIIDSPNKKILHKVFVENGKTISKNEINNLFGHETFYKNYGYEKKENLKYKGNFFRDKIESI